MTPCIPTHLLHTQAERALQAYSSGMYVQPSRSTRWFSAENWNDGKRKFIEGRGVVDVIRIARLERIMKTFTPEHWLSVVDGSIATRAQMDGPRSRKRKARRLSSPPHLTGPSQPSALALDEEIVLSD